MSSKYWTIPTKKYAKAYLELREIGASPKDADRWLKKYFKKKKWRIPTKK